MTLAALSEAFGMVLTPETIAIILLALVISITFGAIPGLGGALAMAILLPLTLFFDGFQALIFLVMIYNGAMYGGSITAILINVPGTAAAAASTLDGYQMTRQGESYRALILSALSSGIGGILADLLAFGMIFVIIPLVLVFTTADFFMITILGITLIAFVSQGSVTKGIIAGMFGLMIATIGIAPGIPDVRYTFGYLPLYDGLSFMAVLIGVFAISEMVKLIGEGGSISRAKVDKTEPRVTIVKYYLRQPTIIIKSTIIGIVVGSIPGSGAAVSNFASYAEQARSDAGSPDEEEPDYGDGNPRGLIAAEGANNATVDGSILPTIAFGIPGSGATALLLGGMVLHGFVPGPSMVSDELPVTFSIFVGLLIGSIFILLFGVFFVSYIAKLTTINVHYIIPLVVVLSLFGAFSFRNNLIDVPTVFIFGIIGYYMIKHNYSIIALIIGVILGGIAEENFIRALQISGGDYSILIGTIPSLIMFLLTLTIIFTTVLLPTYHYLRTA